MRKFLHRFLPSHEAIKANRWLRPFGSWLSQSSLWHLHRRSVAGGVAVGLFCGLIPGPLQMLGAVLLCVRTRVNLPVALFVTLYTNPFTIVPLYMLAYEMGAWVSGVKNGLPVQHFVLPMMRWDNLLADMWSWLAQLGRPLLIGLPLLATGLALAGYVVVRLVWRMVVIWKWQARHRRHAAG